jgi:hypothetical protein
MVSIGLSLSSRAVNLKNKSDTADDRTSKMAASINRALQVRAVDRLRGALVRDESTGMLSLDGLSEAEQRELCEIGGGRLAAVAIHGDGRPLNEIAPLLRAHVRRTDVLGTIGHDVLLVLAPGLDPAAGRQLVDRLRDLLAEHQIRVRLGAAYRSTASPTGWTAQALATEAGLEASRH